MKKKCLICGSLLHGRIDKKFCSDYCRNRYHNSMNASESKYIRHVNYNLRKNRRILQKLSQQGIEEIHRSVLLRAGFDFNYITKMSNKNGACHYYCYEHGYKENCNGLLSLVEDEIVLDTNPIY